MGVTVGAKTVSLTENENGPHKHNVTSSISKGGNDPSSAALTAKWDWDGTTTLKTGLTSSAGTGLGHNNMQPSIGFNYAIKF